MVKKKKVCAFCGGRIIGGNKRQLYDTDYCKQAAARSRRNERRKSLSVDEQRSLAEIYELSTLANVEIEGAVVTLIGCHQRAHWALRMDKLVYLMRSVKELNKGEEYRDPE